MDQCNKNIVKDIFKINDVINKKDYLFIGSYKDNTSLYKK